MMKSFAFCFLILLCFSLGKSVENCFRLDSVSLCVKCRSIAKYFNKHLLRIDRRDNDYELKASTLVMETVLKGLCNSKGACHTMTGEYIAALHAWWYKVQNEFMPVPDIEKYLCVDYLKFCCPCPTYPKTDFTERDQSSGAGAGEGNGTCFCDMGFTVAGFQFGGLHYLIKAPDPKRNDVYEGDECEKIVNSRSKNWFFRLFQPCGKCDQFYLLEELGCDENHCEDWENEYKECLQDNFQFLCDLG
ncbi:cysteine-rich with EGF-like domain protein 2 [Aethina tumida]|uniref:cysteine-rich with EGF-like domain protein 2 n=1 Tax=Aethina tumida TaxID=116153 RepID=UPI002148F70F|nr:cysteine-rich with EGF-like domain protein 2 [Aethina tumida]